MGERKIGEKALKKALKNGIESSSLSPGTVIVRQLAKPTDRIKTNMLNFKAPSIYDAGGDVTKQWFIFYSFLDPATGKFKRFKVFFDLNTYKLKSERMERAIAIKKAYAELLENGFNPFKEFNPGKGFSSSECIDTFLKEIEPQLKKNSFLRFKHDLRRFQTWLEENGMGGVHISEIKRMHIFNYLEWAKKKGKWTSGKSYNSNKNNISRMFNYFINNYDDVVDNNPVSKIESKPVVTRGNQPYNDQEFEAVKTAILENDPYLWRICQFVYYAAVRNEAEGINLKVGDIDFSSKQIIIRPELSKVKKKQFIPIYPEFLRILKDEMKLDQYPSDWFIFGRGDKPGPVRVGKDNFYDRFKKIRALAGLSEHHGIYAFKHTRGCHMVEDGATLYEIQTLFRHSGLHVTMEYLKSIGRMVGEKELSKSRIV